MALLHTLTKIGFSEKKANVYLALLEHGELSASQLASITKLRRTTIYDIIKELLKLKLVIRASGMGEKQTFITDDPEHLTKYIDDRAKSLAEQQTQIAKQQNELGEIIPQLKSLTTASGKPKMQFFDGAKGLVAALNDVLLKKQPFYIYGSLEPWQRWMTDHFEWFQNEVTKRKIDVKRIDQKSLEKLRQKEDQVDADGWPVKLLPVGFSLAGFTLIYSNKVMIASFQKPMATIIEDKDYALSQRTIFEVFWQFLRED